MSDGTDTVNKKALIIIFSGDFKVLSFTPML